MYGALLHSHTCPNHTDESLWWCRPFISVKNGWQVFASMYELTTPLCRVCKALQCLHLISKSLREVGGTDIVIHEVSIIYLFKGASSREAGMVIGSSECKNNDREQWLMFDKTLVQPTSHTCSHSLCYAHAISCPSCLFLQYFTSGKPVWPHHHGGHWNWPLCHQDKF